jgi:transcription elongation factor Elf1
MEADPERIRGEVIGIERLRCMDEQDMECPHCHGLTAFRWCEYTEGQTLACVHCGLQFDLRQAKAHRPVKDAEVPRYATPEGTGL